MAETSIQDILAALGGVGNPVATSTASYVSPELLGTADPTLMNVGQYLNALNLPEYQYNYEDILRQLNGVTDASRAIEMAQLQAAQNQYGRDMAANQATAMDTLRQQYAQGIQNGINKGMQQAGMLSSILGTSQAGAEGAQKIADQRVQAALQYYKDLQQNAVNAQNTATQNQQTLMGNVRQLYNDAIQNRTATLEYNASLQESLANYLASKYNADTSYGATAVGTAGNMSSQNAYSNAYLDAAKAAAEATTSAADKSLEATKYAADHK